VVSDGCICRFDLRGNNLLEVLKHLIGGNAGQTQPSCHNPEHFRGLVSDGFLKADTCERYKEIAVYCGNPDDLAGKQLFFMKGVF